MPIAQPPIFQRFADIS